MNKAITSIGGIKLLLRENKHQSTHTAIVRMSVPAYRETVSMPSPGFGTGHFLADISTVRVAPASGNFN